MQPEPGISDDGFVTFNTALASILNGPLPLIDILPSTAVFHDGVDTVLFDDDDEDSFDQHCRGEQFVTEEEAEVKVGSDLVVTDYDENVEEQDAIEEQNWPGKADADDCSRPPEDGSKVMQVGNRNHDRHECNGCESDAVHETVRHDAGASLLSDAVQHKGETAEDRLNTSSCKSTESPRGSLQGSAAEDVTRSIASQADSFPEILPEEPHQVSTVAIVKSGDLECSGMPSQQDVSGTAHQLDDLLEAPSANASHPQVGFTRNDSETRRKDSDEDVYGLEDAEECEKSFTEEAHDLGTNAASKQDMIHLQSINAHKQVAVEQADGLGSKQSPQLENRWFGSLRFVHEDGDAEDDQHALTVSSVADKIPASPQLDSHRLRPPRLPQKAALCSMPPLVTHTYPDASGSARSQMSTRYHRSKCAEAFSIDYPHATQQPSLKPMKTLAADTLLPRSSSSHAPTPKRRAEHRDEFSPAFSFKSSSDFSVASSSETFLGRQTVGRSTGSRSSCWPPVCGNVPTMSLLPAYAERTHKKRPHSMGRTTSDANKHVPHMSGKNTLRSGSMSPMPTFDDVPRCGRASGSRLGLGSGAADASKQLRLPPLNTSGKVLPKAFLTNTLSTRGRAQGCLG